MAISLISCEDNLTKTKIRCTVGCDYISDLDNIPVGDEDLSELGFANHKLAPWSFALVGEDGLLYYLTTTNEWKPYTNDGSGGGGDKRMVITVTNESGEYSCDKTFEEIYNAGEANSVVIYDGYIYRQVVYTEEDIRYELTDASSDAEMKIAHIDIIQDDSVEYHEYTIEGHKTEGVVIVVEENQTVNGYQVPKMTADDVTRAYNAVVAAKPCTLTDSQENQHFAVNQADTVSSDICINVLYYDKMLLTYVLSGSTVTTEYTEIGGGGDLIVTVSNHIADKTFAEIEAAFPNVKVYTGAGTSTGIYYVPQYISRGNYVDFVYITVPPIQSGEGVIFETLEISSTGEVETWSRTLNEYEP